MDNIENDLVKVYTGNTVTTQQIKNRLEEAGIQALEKSDFYSGEIPGHGDGVPENLDLYVHKNKMIESQKVIEEVLTDMMDN